MKLLSFSYAVYLVLSTVMTVWVARTLFRHGRAFLVDAFRGHAELADSVNHLLVVGFYLVNLGWVCLTMTSDTAPQSAAAALELLSTKIGWVLLMLGVMHFLNVFAISKLRRSSLLDRLVSPASPIPPTS